MQLKNLFKYLKNGLLYYWYTGNKRIAITGFLIASIINLGLLFITVGGTGMVYFILMLIMDHLIILFLAFYLIVRNFIPLESLQNVLDSVIIENFMILLICWIINRVVINLTAEKIYKYELK